MTPEDYKQRYNILTDNYNHSVRNLELDYVRQCSIAKVGDVIEATYGEKIKVNEVNIGMRWNGGHSTPPPICYIGVWLTKKGEPNKRGETRCVSESQIAKVNGEIPNGCKQNN